MRDEVRKSWGPMGWFQRSNKKIVIGVLVVVIAIGALMGTSLRGALTYYVTVDELKAEGSEAFGDRFRVGGRIQRGSMQRDASNNVSFIMYHNERTNSIPVRYNGPVPDIVQGAMDTGEEVDVIVEGRWQAEGVFHATNLLAQHPPEFRIAEPGKPHEPVEDRSY